MANTTPAKKKATPKAKTTNAMPKPKAPDAEDCVLTENPEGRITELLAELEKATMPGKKKAIRRQLRTLGHSGGLGGAKK